MVQLTQSDVAANLATLLDAIENQPVVIVQDGAARAAVISMDRFNELRDVDLAEMNSLSRQMGARVAEHAEELGISPEQLVEQLLAEND